jgi:hypothetical protein
MSAKAWEMRRPSALDCSTNKGTVMRRAMLADIYGRSTEGFNTVDLKDAKTLLDELAE